MALGSRRRRTFSLLATAAAVAAAVVVLVLRPHPGGASDGCTATADGMAAALDLAQAANAAIIASVGERAGLGDHAVTIALATAFQESKLHNLHYGDRDSVGLFQQRPSQGWGTPAQLLDPHYAAAAFYHHLARVPGWRVLPVAEAAQAVQHSAAGYAYADWESAARVVAQALTGEVAQGIDCRYAKAVSSSAGLATAMRADLGPPSDPPSPRAGWRTASWLVAQAAQYSIDTVSYAGLRWTRSSGRWSRHGTGSGVGYTLLR